MAMPPNCVSIAAREPSDGHQRDVPPRKEDQEAAIAEVIWGRKRHRS